MTSTGSAKVKSAFGKKKLAEIDHEDPPEKLVAREEPDGTNSKPSGNARAKAAFFRECAAQPQTTRVIKSRSGDASTVLVRGVVTRVGNINVKGSKGQTTTKLELDIFTIKVGGEAPDFIKAHPKGDTFGIVLPTSKIENAPVEGSGGGHNGPTYRHELNLGTLTQPCRAHDLSFVPRISVYKQDPKGGDKEGLDLITKGMLVQVTGIHANQTGGDSIYVNASGVQPLLDDKIDPPRLFATLKQQLSTTRIAAASAFRLSACLGGFFDESEKRDEWQAQQVERYQDAWRQMLGCAGNSCTNAASVATNSEDEALLKAFAERFNTAAANPQKYAQGAPLFTPLRDATKTTLTAAIVVKPRIPVTYFCPVADAEVTKLIHPDINDLLNDDVSSANLPEMFVCCSVQDPPEQQGMLLRVSVAAQFIGDRDLARKHASELGVNPVLSAQHGTPAILGMNLSLRDVARMTGIIVEQKVINFAKELYQFAEFVAVVPVVGRSPNDDCLRTDDHVFPHTHEVDVPGALVRMAVAVSEEWVQRNLAGGNGQYVYEKDRDQPLMKESDWKTDLAVDISLVKNGFQEITGSSFKLAGAKMPPNTSERKYYVWWQSFAPDEIKQEAIKAQETEKGHAAVEAVCAKEKLSVYDFLLQRAAVFVVAA